MGTSLHFPHTAALSGSTTAAPPPTSADAGCTPVHSRAPCPPRSAHSHQPTAMNDRQLRTVEAFEKSLLFFESHPIKPEPPLLVRLRASLEGTMKRVEELRRAQNAAEWDMKGRVERRKDKLRRDRMMVLARLGKPEVRNTAMELVLQVPHKKASAQEVAEAALRMADAFEEHRQLIVDAGKPASFLDEMRREGHDLQLSERRSGTARGRRSHATRDLAEELSAGMEILDQLEGLVLAHHGSDHAAMKYWKQWRRVPKKKGRPRKRGGEGEGFGMPKA